MLIVLSAKSGLSVGSEKAFKAATKKGIGKIFVVTKTDADHSDFYKTFNSIAETYGASACPVIVPIMENGAIQCYLNLLDGTAYTYQNGKPAPFEPAPTSDRIEAMQMILHEAIASADDALMEKYFEGEPFTSEEMRGGLIAGIASGDICPVVGCSGYNAEAIDLLLDFIASSVPPADQYAGEGDLSCDESGPLSAVVFKTIADPFIGKLSFVKVISGTLSAGAPLLNLRSGENERIGKLLIMRGGKQEDTTAIPAGDIGAITKLSGTKTGDTLCEQGKATEPLSNVIFPSPSLSMAVKVRKKGEEEKVASGLLRLMEEDPSIQYTTNQETREQILSGLGEQHLDVVVSKLKSKFGVEVDLAIPKVAYRETIRKPVKIQGKHKKQSGGHGQYGDVWIEFSPHDGDELVFEEKVFGGSVPRNFFPAVEKGLRDSVSKGVLAGYPMVGLKATLVDGSYHPVDSSEMSFKMAASLAYRNGIPKASPVLLEPIGMLQAYISDEHMGDIIGDINKRRGRVLGMNPAEDNMQELTAEVPMAEMGDFSTTLRSVTQGKGYFSLSFERYEEAPANIAQKVIDDANAEKE